ncbi:peptidase U32 family protein [Bacteroidota bacterium]
MKKIKKPELLAPAGDWKMLVTAVNSGADAVYLGVEKLNMRAKAVNFQLDELPEIAAYCNENNVDTHLTLNTIVYEDELKDLEIIISAAKNAGVDMIICWDMSVIQKCNEQGMPFCISTQASISNSAAANYYKKLGAKRIVLARECTLENIIEIKKSTDIEIETFIHGAMCIAVSGRCLLSHHMFGQSANRGECIQPCRREFEIRDKDEDKSLILGDDYILSPNDLSTIDFIDKLIDAGIDAFKIEGRKRSPEYIAKVVSTYRNAIDLHVQGKLTEEIKAEMNNKLSKVYNRGFSTGFYFGTPGEESYAEKYGSQATSRKVYAGKVLNYFSNKKIAHIRLIAASITKNDDLYIIGKSTGVVEVKLSSMMKDESFVEGAGKGDEITFTCNEKIRSNDQVYKIIQINET